MDLGPLVGTYNSALSKYSENEEGWCQLQEFFSLFERVPFPLPWCSVGPQLSGNNTLCLLRPTHSWKCFFPLPSFLSFCPLPDIMSFPFLTHSHPNFLPLYKSKVMNEDFKKKSKKIFRLPACLFFILFPALSLERSNRNWHTPLMLLSDIILFFLSSQFLSLLWPDVCYRQNLHFPDN